MTSKLTVSQNMRRVGNITSNLLYNPRNTKAAIPMDADEVDGVMERFIRQKYEHKMFNDSHSQPGSRQNTGSTSSDDRPPPLPPKPSKRFHFPSLRSSSSTFPRSDRFSPPVSPGHGSYGREPSPPPKDKKHSRFLGVEVGGNRDDNFEKKLLHLRDMGFTDERRNLKVLKGLNGNVEKAVETLVRLGEGNKIPSRTHSPPLGPPSPLYGNKGSTDGIIVEKARGPPTPSKNNSNPFDQLDVQNKSLPQLPEEPTSPVQQNFSPTNPFHNFAQPSQQLQQQQTLDQSFQNLQLNPPPSLQSPQLFPNSTGGYGNGTGTPNHIQTNPFLQTYTPPPVPQAAPQFSQFNTPSQFTPFGQQQQQQYMQPQQTGQAPNPFLRQSRSQILTTSNSFGVNGVQQFGQQPQQYGSAYPQQDQSPQSGFNPFQQQQQPQQGQQGLDLQGGQQNNSPFDRLPQLSTQQSQQSSPFGQQVQQNSSPFNQQQNSPFGQQQSSPFATQNQQLPLFNHFAQSDPLPQAQFQYQTPASAPPQQQQLFQPPLQQPQQQLQQPQQLQHQNTFPLSQRQDKNSILALYNYPHLAPTRPEWGSGNGEAQQGGDGSGDTLSPLPGPGLGLGKRSVTMPVQSSFGLGAGSGGGSMNPFGTVAAPAPVAGLGANGLNGANGTGTNGGYRHVSHESVDFGGGGLMGGRHSPDAFSGLSARMR
jgi:hypothetical protein